MSLYLKAFTLPIDLEEQMVMRRMEENGGCSGYIDNYYPCCMFGGKGLYSIDFSPVTILYGGNGSGKSTLLNLIAEKLSLHRLAPHNSGELFDAYAGNCEVLMNSDDEGVPYTVPKQSAIFTSDDVFDYMLAVRTNNAEIAEETERGKAEHARLKFGDTVKLRGMEDYEQLRLQVMARSKTLSRRKFLRRTAGEQVRLQSNGETALTYFSEKLENDGLYCLDEPENSMSPRTQLELLRLLTDAARYCGCQLIIATHSPFLLSMDGARIYDLDSIPVRERNWWELENARVYYEFFKKHSRLFE